MDQLPSEILNIIYLDLPLTPAKNLAKTCKRTHLFARKESTWKHRFERDFWSFDGLMDQRSKDNQSLFPLKWSQLDFHDATIYKRNSTVLTWRAFYKVAFNEIIQIKTSKTQQNSNKLLFQKILFDLATKNTNNIKEDVIDNVIQLVNLHLYDMADCLRQLEKWTIMINKDKILVNTIDNTHNLISLIFNRQILDDTLFSEYATS